MAGTPGPNMGFVYGYSSGDTGWGLGGYNPLAAALDALFNLEIISASLTAPPGSPSDGDRYVPAATATGAWAGHENDVARWFGSAWEFYTPNPGWRMHNLDTATFQFFDGSSWSDEPAPAFPSSNINDQTGTSYTLTTADNGQKVVLDNAAPITLIVAGGLGTPFDCVIVQKGAGQVTFDDDSGATTLHSRSAYTKTAGQWAIMTVMAIAADVLVLGGDGA